jgi:hypothetical protein
MKPNKETRGKKFIGFLEFLLEPGTFGLWGSPKCEEEGECLL